MSDGELNISGSRWVTTNTGPVKVVIFINTKLNCQWGADVVFAKKKCSANFSFFLFFKASHLITEVYFFKAFQESLNHHFWITLWCLSQCSPLFSSVVFLPSSWDVRVWYWIRCSPRCLCVVLGMLWSVCFIPCGALSIIPFTPSASKDVSVACRAVLPSKVPHFWLRLTEEATEEKQLRLPRDALLIVTKDEKASFHVNITLCDDSPFLWSDRPKSSFGFTSKT